MNLALAKAQAAAALSVSGRRVHRLILGAFVETGRPPTSAQLRSWRADGIHVDGGLDELAARDLIALDPSGGFRAAYPFSPTSTGIRVDWPGGPGVDAMCAIDALGISAMIGPPTSITSADPVNGARIAVEVEGNRADWTPRGTVVVHARATASDCCRSVDDTCGFIRFFAAAATAHEWLASRGDVTGEVLDQERALSEAVAEFGPLLGGTPC